jgi:hemoglobin
MTKSLSPPTRRFRAGAGPEASLYQRIGAEKVERLVAAFYARVDSDPVIRPLYGKTLSCAIHGLTAFMTAWLGGPPVYDVRGARLRRRHTPFAIDARARDAWLANMKAAVQEVGIPAAEAGLLLAHLEFGAWALVNTGETPEKVPRPGGADGFDSRLAEQWNRIAEAENLFDAVSRGDLALLRSMPGATVDVTSGPTRGTPLHQASRRGYVSVAQALLDHGATIDARDAKGQTPLRRAVNCRQVQIVRLLVRHGADPRAADRREVTPLDVARTAEMKQVLADTGRAIF